MGTRNRGKGQRGRGEREGLGDEFGTRVERDWGSSNRACVNCVTVRGGRRRISEVLRCIMMRCLKRMRRRLELLVSRSRMPADASLCARPEGLGGSAGGTSLPYHNPPLGWASVAPGHGERVSIAGFPNPFATVLWWNAPSHEQPCWWLAEPAAQQTLPSRERRRVPRNGQYLQVVVGPQQTAAESQWLHRMKSDFSLAWCPLVLALLSGSPGQVIPPLPSHNSRDRAFRVLLVHYPLGPWSPSHPFARTAES